LHAKPNRRRARAKGRDHVRPRLEELEPRTVFDASSSAFFPVTLGATQLSPALLGGSTVLNGVNPLALGQLGASGANTLVVLAPPLTTSLGEPLAAFGGPAVRVQPQVPILSPAILSPESLPVNSTAPLFLLSPAAYQLTRPFNAAVNAGSLPTTLNSTAMSSLFEVGGSIDSSPLPVPANGRGGTAPTNGGPTPQDQGPPRSLPPVRPTGSELNVPADQGPAEPEGAAPPEG
jgi:hypothetical protein